MGVVQRDAQSMMDVYTKRFQFQFLNSKFPTRGRLRSGVLLHVQYVFGFRRRLMEAGMAPNLEYHRIAKLVSGIWYLSRPQNLLCSL